MNADGRPEAAKPDMTPEFHRIQRLPPYVFEEVNRLKARLRSQGVDIIDFGMGNPDMPTPKHIVDKMIETARDPKAGQQKSTPACARVPVKTGENYFAPRIASFAALATRNFTTRLAGI